MSGVSQSTDKKCPLCKRFCNDKNIRVNDGGSLYCTKLRTVYHHCLNNPDANDEGIVFGSPGPSLCKYCTIPKSGWIYYEGL
jgi:hypothetical protein